MRSDRRPARLSKPAKPAEPAESAGAVKRAAPANAVKPVTPTSRPRRSDRATLLDLDTTTPATPSAADDATALRQTIARRLTTSVRVDSAGQGAVTRLRHLNLQQLGALEVSGQPMRLCNALSQRGAAFVFTLVDGRCTLVCEAGSVQLQGGSFVVLRGDRTVTAEHAAPFLVRGTRIPAARLQRELGDWQQAELVPVDGTSGPGAVLLALQDQLLTHGNALGSRSADAFAATLACVLADALRGVLLPAAGDALHTQAEHHRRRIRAHVHAHLADAGLDVAGVAAGVGLSAAHVHRLFADEPASLGAWIQAERLDACHGVLQDPSQSLRTITDVAFAWGFRSAAHFSRSFRQRFGQAPRAVRQAALVRHQQFQTTGTIS